MNDLTKFGLQDDIKLISVIGIGTFGTNAVNYLKKNGLTGIDYFVVNSNHPSMEIEQTMEDIKKKWHNRLVFIIVGANEESESVLFQMIGNLVMQFNSACFGLLTIPLSFGKNENREQILENIGLLKKWVRNILLISIEHLLCSSGEASLAEPDQKTYQQLMLTVKTFKAIYLGHNVVSIDLFDLSSLWDYGGCGFITSAVASGENKCLIALDMALFVFPKMEIIKAKKLLLYVEYGSGNEGVTVGEVMALMDYINNKIDESTDLIWSVGFDKDLLEDKIRITIFATGLELDSVDYYLQMFRTKT